MFGPAPRIHFALVCASGGCPALRRGAYAAERVDAELEQSARAFFERPESLRADPAARTVSLSALLAAYGCDFAASEGERLAVLKRFFPATREWDWLEAGAVRVDYLPYDWTLNERRAPNAGESG